MSAIQETPVWFSQPDLIPSEDMDMARKSLFANDEAEFASRIAMYVRYRSGGFNDSWVKSHIHTHEEAIVKVAENSWYGKKDNLPETDVAVKHTPLTATESPKLISAISPGAFILNTAESAPLSIAVIDPSSAISPVNIRHRPQSDRPI